MSPDEATLKRFLLNALADKCDADADVLADYVLALVQNGTAANDFADQLQVFLGPHTEPFILELNSFFAASSFPGSKDDADGLGIKTLTEMGRVAKVDSTIEVDYEVSEVEEDQAEREREAEKEFPQVFKRPLREYSPERNPSNFDKAIERRRPCTSFQKFGRCRFGDSCRFSHEVDEGSHFNRQSPSSSFTTRLTVSLIPAELLKTNLLMEKFGVWGSVTNVLIYPEQSRAIIQYSSTDEAKRAYEEVLSSSGKLFGEENECVEVELGDRPRKYIQPSSARQVRPKIVPTESSQQQQHHHQLTNLLNLQRQQQNLLESHLSNQQIILQRLDSSDVNEELRSELMKSLSSLQSSIINIQRMLKSTTEMMVKIHEQPPTTAINKSVCSNDRNRPPIQTHVRSQSFAPVAQTQFKYNKNHQPAIRAPSSLSKNSLDFRPKTLRLAPLSLANLPDIHALQRHFSPFGPLQSLIVADEGRSAIIQYQRHEDAQKALLSSTADFPESVEFDWVADSK